MSIQITCPSGHTLKIAHAWAGRAGRCPVCKVVVQVPATSPMPGPPPLSPAAVSAPPTIARVGQVGEVHETHLPSATSASGAIDSLRKTAVDNVVAEIGAVPFDDDNGKHVSNGPPVANNIPPPTVAASSTVEQKPAAVSTITPLRPAKTAVKLPTVTTEAVTTTGVTAEAVTAEAVSTEAVSMHAETTEAVTTEAVQSGYQPDIDKRWTTYYLAGSIVALGLFCMAPALPHWNLGAAPAWARAVLLLSLLQLVYGAWVASIPDWTTLRCSMIVLTILAALYALTMTVALTTPRDNTLPLDLTDVRRQAVLWCAGVLLLASLVAYACGRVAWRWRRSLELRQT